MEQMARPRVLVIDDEQTLVEIVQESLTEEGFEVHGACDGESGMRLFYEVQPDLVVLDIVMPDCDGWEICRRLRRVSNLPILMLTARAGRDDLVQGLKIGADDYVTKPFSLEVLRARIDALLRRARRNNVPSAPRIYEAGDVKIDMLTRQVTMRGKAISLTPREFDLLAYLVRFAGRTVPHAELLRQVWGPEYGSETQYLSLYIWYLRNRIEENPRRPRRILTWRGLGYRFVPRLESEPAEASVCRPNLH